MPIQKSGDLTSQKIYKVIESEWPLNLTQVARVLGYDFNDKEEQKKILARVKYHLNKLIEDDRVMTKRVGRSLVVWPKEIEKLRVIHELVKEE